MTKHPGFLKPSLTFVEAVLRGRAKPEEIDDWVDRWHAAGPNPDKLVTELHDKHLHEFLGLTWAEYSEWVKTPSYLTIILDQRRRVRERPTFQRIYAELARRLAARSTCARGQVGCVISSADFRTVFAVGYNGGATGLENNCDGTEPGRCGCVHAEANAVINCVAPRAAEKLVFVTLLPCVMCAKYIVNLGGVRSVTYEQDYRIRDALDVLKRAGIATEQKPLEAP